MVQWIKVVVLCGLLLGLHPVASGQCESSWSRVFTPAAMRAHRQVNGTFFDDGTGLKLIAWDLQRAGEERGGFQVWNGRAWSTWPFLGNRPIRQVILHAINDADTPRLLAAVHFRNNADGAVFDVWVYERGTWRSTRFPPMLSVVSQHILGGADPNADEIYVVGHFRRHGSAERTAVYRYDGTTWSALDQHRYAPTPKDPVWFDDGSGMALYVAVSGPSFFSDTVVEGGVARWDGQAWSQVGPGKGCPANDPLLTVHDDGTGPALWASSQRSKLMARWDGTSWTTWPSGRLKGEQLLSVDVAGQQELLWHDKHALWRWNGQDGETLDSVYGLGRLRFILADNTKALGDGIFALGTFIQAGNIPAASVARWDGQQWHAVGTEDTGNGAPYASSLHAVGEAGGPYLGSRVFVLASNVGGSPLPSGIAAWKEGDWERIAALDGLYDSRPFAMTLGDLGQGPRLYVAGLFRTDPNADHMVMEWTGRTWNIAARDMDAPSHTILYGHMLDNMPSLFLAGSFQQIAGKTSRYVAKLTADGWEHLGEGLPASQGDPYVSSLALHDDGSGTALYVASLQADRLDGMFANHVLRWNGQSWERVGKKLVYTSTDHVSSLLSADLGDGPVLIAGGRFNVAGKYENVAVWDGESWKGLGEHPRIVKSLAMLKTPDGPRLVTTGENFEFEADQEAFFLWTGQAWIPYGIKTNGSLSHVSHASHENDAIYISGSFTLVDGIPSEGIARWGCNTCAADFNSDGTVDAHDVADFLIAWTAHENPADFDGNGLIDTRDIVAFLKAWSVGC